MAAGAKWAEHALLQLSFLQEFENGRTMHKNELICQKCAINCGIEGNASNENITKYKNLSGVKSISNSVQGLARYRIVALISIGRLCTTLSQLHLTFSYKESCDQLTVVHFHARNVHVQELRRYFESKLFLVHNRLTSIPSKEQRLIYCLNVQTIQDHLLVYLIHFVNKFR